MDGGSTGRRAVAALAVVITGLVTSCGGPPASGGNDLRILVPNTPGGGYDVTARTAAKVMRETGLVRNVDVFNLPGAGGTVGLSRLVGERGNGRLTMQIGLGLVGGIRTNRSALSLADTTPIVRLIEEPEVVVVAENSPFRDLRQLLRVWRDDPGTVPVGGGSSPGGPDHLTAMLIAKGVGIAPKRVNYVSFDGGGELLAAVLGDEVAFGVSGVGEYADQLRTGQLRALAVTGAARTPEVDAPTLREGGIDAEFMNWRGVVAPPGLSEPDRQALVDLHRRLRESPQWAAAMAENGWRDAFLTGADFGRFLDREAERVDTVLTEWGMGA